MKEEEILKIKEHIEIHARKEPGLCITQIMWKAVEELEHIAELEKELAISEHDREHNDYELVEVYKKVEQLEKRKHRTEKKGMFIH